MGIVESIAQITTAERCFQISVIFRNIVLTGKKWLLFTTDFYRKMNPIQNLFYLPKVLFKSPHPQKCFHGRGMLFFFFYLSSQAVVVPEFCIALIMVLVLFFFFFLNYIISVWHVARGSLEVSIIKCLVNLLLLGSYKCVQGNWHIIPPKLTLQYFQQLMYQLCRLSWYLV